MGKGRIILRMTSSSSFTGRVSLAKALRRGFVTAYDNLGYIALVSFGSSLATFVVFSAGLKLARMTDLGIFEVIFAIPAGLVAWLAAVGLFYYAKKLIYHEYPSTGDTLSGIRILIVPALALFFINLVVTALLLGDAIALFLAKRAQGICSALGVLCVYMTIVWLMAALYHLPLLAFQLDMPSGPRPFVVIRKSFLLLADNPAFTVGLFAAIIALAVICAIPGFVGMVLFYPGATAFVITHGLRELFVKYGMVEEEPEIVEDKGWPQRD